MSLLTKIPVGTYEGRTLGWLLDLKDADRVNEWLAWALRADWHNAPAFGKALKAVCAEHRPHLLPGAENGGWVFTFFGGGQYREVVTEYGSALVHTVTCGNCGTERGYEETLGDWIEIKVMGSGNEGFACSTACVRAAIKKFNRQAT